MAYFVKDSEGNKYGPYGINELKELVEEQRVVETTVLVDADTEMEFQASSILEFKSGDAAAGNAGKVPPQSTNSTQVPVHSGEGYTSQAPPQTNTYNNQRPGDFYYQQRAGNSANSVLIIISFVLIIICPLAGIITSIIAMNNANKYGESKTVPAIALAINSIFVVLGLVWVVYALNVLEKRDTRTQNLSHMKMVGMALMMYAEDNNYNFPNAQNWQPALMPYVKNDESLLRPPEKKLKSSFAMNDFYSSVNTDYLYLPAQEVVFFEAPFGVAFGNEQSVFTKEEEIPVLYCDEHVSLKHPDVVIEEVIAGRAFYNKQN